MINHNTALEQLEIARHLRKSGIIKGFGYSCFELFQIIFLLIFHHKNWFRMFKARKISCYQNHHEKRKWLAILSTDCSLSDEEIVRIYGMRWKIEIFFKFTKSHLNLAKEFQGRSYDMLISHTTIVFFRYIFFSLWRKTTIRPKITRRIIIFLIWWSKRYGL